jgi:hypothetical protein
MQAAQGDSLMEKQPNSRMCFVCGIENPIGLKLKFYTDEGGGASPASSPNHSTRAILAICTAGSSAHYWTSQLKFQCTLALYRYDWVLPHPGETRSM